jgi:hypothetical protein
MEGTLAKIRAVAQVLLSIAVIAGAITGNQIVLLIAATVLVGLILWEADVRRRRRV